MKNYDRISNGTKIIQRHFENWRWIIVRSTLFFHMAVKVHGASMQFNVVGTKLIKWSKKIVFSIQSHIRFYFIDPISRFRDMSDFPKKKNREHPLGRKMQTFGPYSPFKVENLYSNFFRWKKIFEVDSKKNLPYFISESIELSQKKIFWVDPEKKIR